MPSEDLPRTATDLLGHAAAERAFLDAWTSGRMHHAWLIGGPRGIGKATLAYRIARFVLSGGGEGAGGLFGGGPESLDVAPDHPAARRIAAGGHGDLKVIERPTDEKTGKRKSEIPVDEVRDIGHFLSLTPAEGGWRVVIIDAADEMNRNAANAVLKVLEEPPKRALMLLVSHSPARLLPTIRSRCRRISLQPLPEPQLLTLLDRFKPGLDVAEATALARLAEGSIGKALALAEEGGLELYRDMVGLLSTLPRLDVPALHAFGDRVGKSDEGFRTVSDLLAWWLARLVQAAGTGGLSSGEVVAGEGALIGRLGGAAGLDQWVEVWEKITHLFARADAVHLDRKQVILSAFLAVERLVRA